MRVAWRSPWIRDRSPAPPGRNPAGGGTPLARRLESVLGEMPVLGQRCELIAQRTEAVALLTQDAAIDGSVELTISPSGQSAPNSAASPASAETSGDATVGSLPNGVVSTRGSRGLRDFGLPAPGRGRRGRLRFLVDRIDFLRDSAGGPRRGSGRRWRTASSRPGGRGSR